jgi:hypothetical protein
VLAPGQGHRRPSVHPTVAAGHPGQCASERQPRQPGPAMEAEQVSVPAMTGHRTALHLRVLGRPSHRQRRLDRPARPSPSSRGHRHIHNRNPRSPRGRVRCPRWTPPPDTLPDTIPDPGRVRTDGGRLCRHGLPGADVAATGTAHPAVGGCSDAASACTAPRSPRPAGGATPPAHRSWRAGPAT